MRRFLVAVVSLSLLAACASERQSRAARPEGAAAERESRAAEPAAAPEEAEEVEIDYFAAGRNAAIVAGYPEAVRAGYDVLREGGNAFDAAVATLFAESVTEPTKFHWGGEVPIITYEAETGRVDVLCGLGAAPERATLEHFKSIGGIPPPRSENPVNAPVPGAFHACCTLLKDRGTASFERVAAPSVRLLRESEGGWQADLADTLGVLVDAERAALARGATPEEAIQAVIDEFYSPSGSIARRLDRWCRENGALLRLSDLAAHETCVEEPVSIDYKGYTIYKPGPWTQGPYLLECVQILEPIDLAGMGYNSPDYIHALVESLKLGLADRDYYFGDPDFADVPLEAMLSEEYAALRRGLIEMDSASKEILPGDPRGGRAVLPADEREFGPQGPIDDTTTCIVRDEAGNVVVATPSGWGGTLAGDTGIWLSSRLSSFNTWEGHPNCIRPGKRPRITLTPTLVTRGGEPVIAVSVAGGDWQDQITLQLILGRIEFGVSPARAVTGARYGTVHLVGSFSQPPPELGSLEITDEAPEETIEALRARGHEVRVQEGPYWSPSMMTFDPETGLTEAAGDPEAQRNAVAY